MFDVSKMKDLVKRLNKYRDYYYNRNISLISDREYDSLYDQLCDMEKEHGVVLSNSPTQNVGYTVVGKLNKVKHNHSLLSLDKTTDINEFVKFFHNKEYLLMAKLDGLTCSLYYNNGELIRAETRGDGEIGEDITHNAKMFSNIPLKIDYTGELIVDGECIITVDEFNKINEREHTQYKNPRNLVSGTVRQLDNKVVKSRNVKFIAWKLHLMGSDEKIDSHYCRLLTLKDFGFEIVPCVCLDKNFSYKDYANFYVDLIKTECEIQNIPIDGIVGMFDSKSYGDSLGTTGHHPKHSLAFKFYQDENETILTDIEWTTSRTGTINPVAIFELVEIDGTTVSRATLNNVSCIKELELGIGDTITVIKANQIIPMITQNLTRSNTYKIPIVCPSCGKPTTIKNDNGREILCCENPNCKGRLLDKLCNFVSRNGMDIEGLSEERLKIFIDNGFISDYSDVFTLRLHKFDIMELPGFGEDSIDNIIKAIDKSKRQKLSNVIVAIGIPNIGKSTSKIISAHCSEKYNPETDHNTFDTFIRLVAENYDWSNLPSIGKSTSNSINYFILSNIDSINILNSYIDIDEIQVNNTINWQKGKTFCITGKLNYFKNRTALISDIESNGGKVVSGVTSNTNFLITNDKTSGSAKNKAAEKYGVKIISEDEYISCNIKN